MSRFILILAMIFVSFSSVDFASAVSVYDDVYRTTDNLIVNKVYGQNQNNCGSDIDVASDWYGRVITKLPGNPSLSPTQTSFKQAVTNGWDYGISTYSDSNNNKTPFVFWATSAPTGQHFFNWGLDSLSLSGTSFGVSHLQQFGEISGCPVSFDTWNITSLSSPVISGSSTGLYSMYRNFFVSTTATNYPTDYMGLPIRKQFDLKTSLTSVFDIVKTGTQIAVTPSGFSSDLPQGLKVCHNIVLTDSSNNYLISKKIGLDQSVGLQYDFKDYGTYYVTVTPSDCGVPYVSIATLISPVSTTVDVVIDGTSSVFQSSEFCDSSGTCSTTGLEDCDALDVACELRNLGRQITTTLYNLFVPTKVQVFSLMSRFNDFMHDQFGFLWFPFDFFIKLLTQFSLATDSCTFSSSVPGANISGTFFGSSVTLSVCSAEQDSPQIYNLVVFFIRLVVVSTLLVALFYRMTQFYLEGKSGSQGIRGRNI